MLAASVFGLPKGAGDVRPQLIVTERLNQVGAHTVLARDVGKRGIARGHQQGGSAVVTLDLIEQRNPFLGDPQVANYEVEGFSVQHGSALGGVGGLLTPIASGGENA